MEGREKPHMVKYKAITNNWNYDASCTLTSLPVWDFVNLKRLVFVVQSVYEAFPLLLCSPLEASYDVNISERPVTKLAILFRRY
jgi:hypothetical protein